MIGYLIEAKEIWNPFPIVILNNSDSDSDIDSDRDGGGLLEPYTQLSSTFLYNVQCAVSW